jgi:MFS family permease
VSTSVIVADLLKAFDTNAAALGLMSSIYFYIYAAEQPLVGYLADRWGPRKVIGGWSLLAGAGCFLFGLAPNIWWASVGRALIGFGVGGVYVPAIKAFSQWFETEEFTTMIGLLMAVGNFGAVIATTPLAWAADFWGWRLTFFLIGVITFALALMTLLFTRDHQELTSASPMESYEPAGAPKRSKSKVKNVLSSAQFWVIAIIFFGIYGTFITLQGLWATPFLMTIFKLERLIASNLNMLIPVGVILGAPGLGWMTDRFSFDKKIVLIAILSTYNLAWMCVTFLYEVFGVTGCACLLFVMGIVAGGFISILWGVVRESVPHDILGLTSGLLNPAPFFGVAVFQLLTGAILDRFESNGDLYSLPGFKSAFIACLIANIICLALSFCLVKPKKNTR